MGLQATWLERHRYKTFPSLRKVLLDSTILENVYWCHKAVQNIVRRVMAPLMQLFDSEQCNLAFLTHHFSFIKLHTNGHLLYQNSVSKRQLPSPHLFKSPPCRALFQLATSPGPQCLSCTQAWGTSEARNGITWPDAHTTWHWKDRRSRLFFQADTGDNPAS